MTRKISFFFLFAIMMAFTGKVNATCTGLTMQKNANYSNQSIVANSTMCWLGSFIKTNGCSEDMLVSNINVSFTLSSVPITDITNLRIKDATTGQWLGMVIINPILGNNNFTVSSLLLAAGASKQIDVFADLGSTPSGTIQITLNYSAIGVSTYTAYPVGPTTGVTGQIITLMPPPPTAHFVVDTNQTCTNSVLNITNNSTFDSTLSYCWSIPEANQFQSWTSYNLPTGGISFYSAGVKTVNLKIVSFNGGSNIGSVIAEYSKQITVWPSPYIDGGILPQNGILGCNNSSVTLSANVIGATSYKWRNGMDSIVATTATFSTSLPGYYSLEVKNSHGCKNSWGSSTMIQNHPPMNPQIVYYNNQGAGKQPTPIPVNSVTADTVQVCDNGGLGYEFGFSSYGGNVATFFWDNSYAGQYNHTFYQGGRHYLKAFDNYGCSETDSIFIVIHQIPNAIITGNLTFCQGDNTNLSLNSGTGYTYWWSDGSTNQTINVNYSGMVQGNVKSSFGCTNSAIVQTVSLPTPDFTVDTMGCDIIVSVPIPGGGEKFQWYKNNILLPGDTNSLYQAHGSGFYRVKVTNIAGCYRFCDNISLKCSTAGIPIVDENKENIFPNPFQNNFNVEFSDNENHLIKLYDVIGREIYQTNGKNLVKIEKENLKTGLYFVGIDNRKELIKIIKN